MTEVYGYLPTPNESFIAGRPNPNEFMAIYSDDQNKNLLERGQSSGTPLYDNQHNLIGFSMENNPPSPNRKATRTDNGRRPLDNRTLSMLTGSTAGAPHRPHVRTEQVAPQPYKEKHLADIKTDVKRREDVDAFRNSHLKMRDGIVPFEAKTDTLGDNRSTLINPNTTNIDLLRRLHKPTKTVGMKPMHQRVDKETIVEHRPNRPVYNDAKTHKISDSKKVIYSLPTSKDTVVEMGVNRPKSDSIDRRAGGTVINNNVTTKDVIIENSMNVNGHKSRNRKVDAAIHAPELSANKFGDNRMYKPNIYIQRDTQTNTRDMDSFIKANRISHQTNHKNNMETPAHMPYNNQTTTDSINRKRALTFNSTPKSNVTYISNNFDRMTLGRSQRDEL